MQSPRTVFHCAGAALLLLTANIALAACPWASADEVCSYFLPGLCETGSAICLDKDCLGKNFGEEVMVVPGGGYASIWIARTDGAFFDFGAYPCDVASHRGATVLEIPYWEDGHQGCLVGLATEDHWYLEFFANNRDIECFGWTECQCE